MRRTTLTNALNFFSAVRSRNGTTPPTDAGRGHAARDACLATGPPARSMRRAAAYLPRPKRFSPLGAEWEHGTRQERPPPRPSVGLLPACSPPRVPSSGRGPPRASKNARASAGLPKTRGPWAFTNEIGEIQPSYGSILTNDSHLFTKPRIDSARCALESDNMYHRPRSLITCIAPSPHVSTKNISTLFDTPSSLPATTPRASRA